jgi:hypothetical protein
MEEKKLRQFNLKIDFSNKKTILLKMKNIAEREILDLFCFVYFSFTSLCVQKAVLRKIGLGERKQYKKFFVLYN